MGSGIKEKLLDQQTSARRGIRRTRGRVGRGTYLEGGLLSRREESDQRSSPWGELRPLSRERERRGGDDNGGGERDGKADKVLREGQEAGDRERLTVLRVTQCREHVVGGWGIAALACPDG